MINNSIIKFKEEVSRFSYGGDDDPQRKLVMLPLYIDQLPPVATYEFNDSGDQLKMMTSSMALADFTLLILKVLGEN